MNTIEKLTQIHLKKGGFISNTNSQTLLINFVAAKSNIRVEFENLTPEDVLKIIKRKLRKNQPKEVNKNECSPDQ